MIAIGKIGIWFAHNAMSIAESVAFAQKVEACGYGTLWIPEAIGREPFVHLAYLASQTSALVLATGIANIWARDAVTMAAAQKTLVEISGNRFLLGLGVSHAPLEEILRGAAEPQRNGSSTHLALPLCTKPAGDRSTPNYS